MGLRAQHVTASNRVIEKLHLTLYLPWFFPILFRVIMTTTFCLTSTDNGAALAASWPNFFVWLSSPKPNCLIMSGPSSVVSFRGSIFSKASSEKMHLPELRDVRGMMKASAWVPLTSVSVQPSGR